MVIRARSTQDADRSLGHALHRAIEVARARVDDAAARRREIEMQLAGAREVEESARHHLEALEELAREASEGPAEPERDDVDDTALQRLSGGALREMIARVALRQTGGGEAMHWRGWLSVLRQAGFDAAGKSPEATFQTQLARSPLARRTEQDGVYILDLAQVGTLRDRLSRQIEQLSRLPPAGQLALMGDVRAQRQELQTEIARAERALEEMWRVLAQERPPGWTDGEDVDPQQLVEAWMAL